MDTMSDREAKEIWQRVKRYINPENIKAGSREELAKEIDKQMTLSGKSGKAGSMDSLVRNGFGDRISRVDGVKDAYVEPATIGGKKLQVKAVRKEAKKQSPNEKKLRYRGTRVSVKSKGRFRSFKSKNVRVTRGTWGGRSAFYTYNVRTKKRISWGFVE